MLESFDPGTNERIGRLSPRELQVLELTSTGLTNAEMAAGLALSISAVKFHLASIFRKLDVTNRTEAAVAYSTANRTHGPADAERGHSA